MEPQKYVLWPSKQEGFFKKLLLLTLAFLIPFVPCGYGLEVLRRSAKTPDSAPGALPEFDISKIWNYFADGFKASIVVLIFTIPLSFPKFYCNFARIVSETKLLDIDLTSGSGIAALIFLVMTLLAFVCTPLSGIILVALTPAAMIRAAYTESVTEMFDFGRLMAIMKVNVNHYVVAVLIGMFWMAIPPVLGIFFIVFLLIGFFLPYAYGTMAYAHYLGHWAAEHGNALAEAGVFTPDNFEEGVVS